MNYPSFIFIWNITPIEISLVEEYGIKLVHIRQQLPIG